MKTWLHTHTHTPEGSNGDLGKPLLSPYPQASRSIGARMLTMEDRMRVPPSSCPVRLETGVPLWTGDSSLPFPTLTSAGR